MRLIGLTVEDMAIPMAGIKSSNLQPAHKGYRYQDLGTAYTLVHALVEQYVHVVVDRKIASGDRMDDLEVVTKTERIRRQFKSSDNPTRCLSSADFTSDSVGLRFDHLVLTHVRSGMDAADEYRLCATWRPPLADDSLATLLTPVQAEPTIKGWSSNCFRFQGKALWPEGREPIWTALKGFNQDGAEFGRNELLSFCDRFVVELSLPIASTSLLDPGPLETALIEELGERIGIGRYPNHGRQPADVAALAVSLANLARTQSATLTPGDVERELGIRTDFGRVAQAFPIEMALFHNRPQFRQLICAAAFGGEHQLIIGPPGAGKSWELTQLAEDLRAGGAIVARHYCYLEPGDELVERRVTADVFFGNLIAELIDAAPELKEHAGTRYAADLVELEALLSAAAKIGKPVVLIVDGLDHIARVRAEVRSLSENETDIIERLASVAIPKGVTIVVGSQPGTHLDPLRTQWHGVHSERLLPSWAPQDIVALAERYGIRARLEAVGIADPEKIQCILLLLSDRAEGIPLYARYLLRSLESGLRDGSIGNPIDWLNDAPAIAGDIAVYYAHIYRTIGDQGQVVADIISSIDFSITQEHLSEMVPAYVASHIPATLVKLSPALTTSVGQGGIRVFHESFRRFMRAEQVRAGRSPGDSLAPVVTWLEGRGFFCDAKSFRFLLPALRRSGRDEELLQQVGTNFVSDSVAHGHPLVAIQRNISLAADVAARRSDWPALIRCVELHRSAFTCFDESQGDVWGSYWASYIEIFGVESAVERLLFDGRPTLGRGDGLQVCKLVDDEGGVAPWREYLAMPREADNKNNRNGAEPREFVAMVQGCLQTGQRLRVLRWLKKYLMGTDNEVDLSLMRRLAACAARVIGPILVCRLVDRLASRCSARAKVLRRAIAALRLGIADEHARCADSAAATSLATQALEATDQPGRILECFSAGAVGKISIRLPSLSSIPLGIAPGERIVEENGVRAWLTLLRLNAIKHKGEKLKKILDTERQRVEGIGWYRCWLRFAISVAEAEGVRRREGTTDLLAAFKVLSEDTHPFRGSPRAMDLYSIHGVISGSIELGLAMLRTEAEWSQAVEILVSVAHDTASCLDREDGGPISSGTLIELLLPYVTNEIAGPIVRLAIESEISRRNEFGTYYGTHAEFALRLVIVRAASGNQVHAREAWDAAAVYLSAYGWHKDITIYEVIDSIPSLLVGSQARALAALVEVQPLANAVVVHTDHRSTRHAPNAWLRNLIEVAPAAGIALAARTIVEDEGNCSWQSVAAIQTAVELVMETANPLLTDAILATLEFEVDADNVARERVEERLAPAERIAQNNPSIAVRAFRRAAASIANDGARHSDEAVRHMKDIATKLGVVVPTGTADRTPRPSATQIKRANAWPTQGIQLPWMHEPAFIPSPSVVDLMAGLRRNDRKSIQSDSLVWESVNNPLSYHISVLVETGREEDAERLLRFYAREITSLSIEHPIAGLATRLENAGHDHLAAVAYALAFTATRGGGGWLQFGDDTHSKLVQQGLLLGRTEALEVIGDEVAYTLRGMGYYVGMSRHLIRRISEWADGSVTEQSWREAYKVVAHRLPLAPRTGWFSRLSLDEIPDWSIDESLVAVILARISTPVLGAKISALAAFVCALRHSPEAIAKPLVWWLTYNTPVSSMLLVLDAILKGEEAPFVVSRAIEYVLVDYAAGAIWGAKRLARILLVRAGALVPASASSSSSIAVTDHSDPLTPERQATLLRADVGGILDVVSPVWPELPSIVALSLDRILASPQKEKSFDRYKLAFGRNNNAVPTVPIFFWEREIFLAVLNDKLLGLSARLWSIGLGTSNMEDELLPDILPTSEIHMAFNESRTIRPLWPSAALLVDGSGPLIEVGADDPEFLGWVRLALVERQYICASGRYSEPPTDIVDAYAGAIAVPIGGVIPDHAFPFGEGDVSDCWSEDIPPPSFPSILPFGPVISLAHKRDWLGTVLVPVPPPRLRTYITLIPPAYGLPLIWSDGQGTPALAIRTWCERNSDSGGASPVKSEGADLIVRADVADRISSLYGVPLQELCRVRRRSSPQD